jgi:spore coat polysaccharide biosynthesis predicted glycosyltransferase SpsG
VSPGALSPPASLATRASGPAPAAETLPWLLRVASRPEVGAGHVSRCRALALALGRHAGVVLVLDREGAAWQRKLGAEGLESVVQGQEPPGPWAGSILDGYDVAPEEVAALARAAPPLVAIDDFLEPPRQADLVVNPAPNLEGESVGGIPALLGPAYALLDPRFEAPPPGPVADQVEHVVVTFGARDSANATALALAALALLDGQGVRPRLTVAMASRAPHLEQIRQAVAGFGGRAALRLDAADMAALLGSADLVIGAGGVSLLERMARGVPSISVATADNQGLAIEGAARLGATVSAIGSSGALAELSPEALAGTIATLAGDRGARAAMAARGRELVDGRGARRVAEALARLSQEHHQSTLASRETGS